MKLIAAAALLALTASAWAGTWQPLTNQPPMPDIVDPATGMTVGPGGASYPLLLTDGSVMVQNNSGSAADGRVFKLIPDLNGNYVNGTWSEIAPMPYIPTASAQAVLADGRVIIEGGEFTGVHENFTLTNQGAIYTPATNSWKFVAPPAFFQDLYPPRATFAPHPIGDAASVVLPDGSFMLQDKMSRQAARLNVKTMKWTETGTATKSGLNDEEGWTLLPNGKVLTVDCYTDFVFGLSSSYPSDPTNSELYDPESGVWTSAGITINTLTDPAVNETGPAILRPDGSIFAVGSQGYTSIYQSFTGAWSGGPRLPISAQGQQMTVQDGPAALLPNGNVIFAATGGATDSKAGYAGPPVYFFEFDGQNLLPQPTIPNNANDNASSVVLLVLPTGQILEADGSKDIEIYTPDDASFNPAWTPVIMSSPLVLNPGKTYTVSGFRFNGMSQASAFGDENQNATNYPLVRITNVSTHHVFYSRTHNHSRMAVASNLHVSTKFDVPAVQEPGPSKLEVVANGVPSPPVAINVVATKTKHRRHR